MVDHVQLIETLGDIAFVGAAVLLTLTILLIIAHQIRRRRRSPVTYDLLGELLMKSTVNHITLVYRDSTGEEHTQPLADITEVGTLIDPHTGDDMDLVDARVHPSGNPIVLGAESLRAEVHEAPHAHRLTEEQVAAIISLSDEEIDRVISAEVDDDFWAAYDEARSSAIMTLAEHIRRPR